MTGSTKWLYIGNEIFFGERVGNGLFDALQAEGTRIDQIIKKKKMLVRVFVFKSLHQKTLNVIKDEAKCTKKTL